MAYATQADLLEQEGEDVVYAAFDRDQDGVLDTQAISDALDNASATIDSYISIRYELPLPVAPAWGKRLCIDIALYFGSRRAGSLTTELRKRYDDAIAFLKDVAAGIAGLGVPTASEPQGDGDGLVKGGEILVDEGADNPRLFTRCTTRGL
jgi:phage gp36-like protein